MEAPDGADEWQRVAGKTQVLVRSRIEITAILQSIAAGDLPLVSHHQIHDHLFIAKLHGVFAEQDYIVVGYSDNKTANAEVFEAGTVLFGASHPKGHVSFMAVNPLGLHDPVESIRFDLPKVLLIEQRRVDKRIRVVPEATLRCLADDGGIMPFEASIVDIGLSGVGVMVYDPAITLRPGTVLRGCRIDLPEGGVAAVDIEVMHAASFKRPDGSSASRAGCRFIGEPEKLDRLLKVFVLDLERRGEESGD